MYKLVLPVRYLIKRRITFFAVLAVALCVFVVLVVMTVLSDLTGDIKQKYHSFVGDCVVDSKSLVGFAYYEEFMSLLDVADFIEAACPVIRAPALWDIRTETGISDERLCEIVGIDPVRYSQVTGFSSWLKYAGSDIEDVFAPAYDPNLVGCVSGPLADWFLSPGSEVPLPRIVFEASCFPLTAKGALARAATGLISTKTFHLSNIASVGLPRIDSEIIYVPFEQAQVLCGMAGAEKRINEIHIKFKPGTDARTGSEKVALMWDGFAKKKAGAKYGNLLSQVKVKSWQSYKREIIAALDTEQAMMFFIFALIGLITVFIVFVVCYMIVSHKTKDIGILKSVGASRGEIMTLFLSFGFLVGLLGTVIGAAGGCWFLLRINEIEIWLFEHFEIRLWQGTVSALGNIPNRIRPELLAGVIAAGIAACLIGAFVPSIQAARRRPIETLQVSQI